MLLIFLLAIIGTHILMYHDFTVLQSVIITKVIGIQMAPRFIDEGNDYLAIFIVFYFLPSK